MPSEAAIAAEDRRNRIRDTDLRRAKEGTSFEERGGSVADLSPDERPSQVAAMFNGVQPSATVARPSRDSRAPTAAELEALNSPDTSEPFDSELPALAPEDLSKSRDDKVGGLVSARTPRERAVEEGQAAAPFAPAQGVETKVLGDAVSAEQQASDTREEDTKAASDAQRKAQGKEPLKDTKAKK